MIRFLQTPSRTKKIVLGGLLLIICFAMVITLIPGFGSSDFATTQGMLARVGGEDVTTNEVQTLARRIARQQFGNQAVPEALMPYVLQNAAQSLIMQKALSSEANRLGLQVTDAELRQELHQGQFGEALFPNGAFIGQEQYENLVSTQFNMSVMQFEQAVKQELLIRKLRDSVGAGVAVSEDELKKEFQKQNTKVKLEYALLSLDDLKKQIKPADAELKAWFEQNKARYQNSVPEKRKAKYVVVDTLKVLANVKATLNPEELQKYYEAHREEFRVSEQVQAAHILIKTPPPGPDGKVDPKGEAAAKAKAEDILKKLRGGADFAEMAKKESQDTGSATQGGDLGFFQRGAMVPEFDKAAFSQPVGKIGDLVKTSFGYHIIKVEARQEAQVKPFAEVKDGIATRVAQDTANTQAEQLANKIETQARTQGIEKAAAENRLELHASDWFARTDSLPGIGSAPEFNAAAFAAKQNGPPELAKFANGYAVVLVTDVKPAETPAFEQIRAKVETDYKGDRAQQMLGQKAQELADRAHAEHDLKKAARELGAAVKTSELLAPTGQAPDLGSMSGPASVAFDLKQGEISGALNLGSSAAVLSVLERQEPGPEEFTRQKDQIRERLMDQKRERRLQMFISGVRQKMEKDGKIKINKDEWTRVMGSAPSAS